MNFLFAAHHIIDPSLFRPSILAVRSPSVFSDSVAGALFESHWAWWIAAAAIGALLVYLAASRADRRLQKAGIGTLAAVLVWIAAAYFIVTPAERLRAVHESLAEAARSGDVDAILRHFSPGFTAAALSIEADTANTKAREEIATRLREHGIKESKITKYQHTQRDGRAFTEISVLTTTNYGPIPSSWQLNWDDLAGEDWKIVNVRVLQIANQNMTADQVIP